MICPRRGYLRRIAVTGHTKLARQLYSAVQHHRIQTDITLLPRADSPAFQTLALSKARYEKSDAREINIMGSQISQAWPSGLPGRGVDRAPAGVSCAYTSHLEFKAQTRGVLSLRTKPLERNECISLAWTERDYIVADTQVWTAIGTTQRKHWLLDGWRSIVIWFAIIYRHVGWPSISRQANVRPAFFVETRPGHKGGGLEELNLIHALGWGRMGLQAIAWGATFEQLRSFV